MIGRNNNPSWWQRNRHFVYAVALVVGSICLITLGLTAVITMPFMGMGINHSYLRYSCCRCLLSAQTVYLEHSFFAAPAAAGAAKGHIKK